MSDRRVAVILFEGFELLDVFGPVELLHVTPGFTIDYYGPQRGPIASSQGGQVVAEHAYDELVDPDIILVPGGYGTRPLAEDAEFLKQLKTIGTAANLVTSVCTGSGLLAAAGLLDSYRATSNKLAFGWASSFGTDVEWVSTARWVHDRDRWTSSGVAAGMDMAAALIADLCGTDVAREATVFTELEVHSDSTWDPFAAIHGLA
ncbi:MAG TPA: DJ-1/PfpI family protein [Flexivirga sp.]|uniref:DJ-1/PfpI family protein n=1 Tax=Flexivirga sp. TaxID=1962927 RepID=UPI002CB51DD1|nr:DJ-1/PfpI family protein [Flexivirga sp.]HWC20769.1 DJ-1/PfpI family protein [Flexivirga sp.]